MSTVLPTVGPISSAPAAAASPAARVARIRQTAQQFEAIFIRELLAAAHKTKLDDTPESSPGADSFVEQQNAHFADIAAQKGSFGLGRMIENQLLHQQGLAATPNPAAGR